MLGPIAFWHWWILAAILIGIEVFAPTTLFLWTGVAAAAVGFLVLIAPGLGWEYQVLVFAVVSVASVLAHRQYARRHPVRSDSPNLNRRAQQYVGRTFTLEDPIVNGQGKIKVDDSTWKIEGTDMGAGRRVKVIGVDGTILKVEEV